MIVTLYTTHCPRCEVLKEKLTQASISFIEEDNEDFIIAAGIMSVPVIELPNGQRFNFKDAVDWINTTMEVNK